MLNDLLPILVLGACCVLLSAAILALSALVGQRKPTAAKLSPYECGIAPTGDARDRFTVRFYLVAMLFILFDVETVFFYPWAVVFRQLRVFAVAEMAVFVLILVVGYLYVWRSGGLEWE